MTAKSVASRAHNTGNIMGTINFNSAHFRHILKPHLGKMNEADLTSFLYAQVKDALKRHQDREQVQDALYGAYSQVESEDSTEEQDAIGNVLACFEGYCAPADML